MARILAPLFFAATPAVASDGTPGQGLWLGLVWAVLLAMPVMAATLAPAALRRRR